MKRLTSGILIGALLIACSIAVYIVQIFIFRSGRDTFFYLLQDLAFLPLQILIVTLIVNRILNAREKREKLKKMNMVISTFFIETGSKLISIVSKFNPNLDEVMKHLVISGDWNDVKFTEAGRRIKGHPYIVDSRVGSLEKLRDYLLEQRGFLLSLLENPNLLEHDSFTEMLWAVFHITDELCSRDAFSHLPQTDLDHLSVDIKRAYVLLIQEWLNYMRHLKNDYPYLFSLAVRKNPFNPDASVIVG